MSQGLLPVTLIDPMAAGIDIIEPQAPGLYLVRRLGYLPYARVHVRSRDVLVAVYRPGVRRDAMLAKAKAPTLCAALRLRRLMLRQVCLGEVCRS